MQHNTISLTRIELSEITGFKLAGKQIQALVQMGIPFKVRPDGTPLVFRASLTDTQDARPENARQPVMTLI